MVSQSGWPVCKGGGRGVPTVIVCATGAGQAGSEQILVVAELDVAGGFQRESDGAVRRGQREWAAPAWAAA